MDSSRTNSFLLLSHCHPMQAFIRNIPGYVLTGRADSWNGWVPGSANGMHVHVGPHGRAPLWGHTGPVGRPAWWVPMGVLYGAKVWGARAVRTTCPASSVLQAPTQVWQDVENGPCTWRVEAYGKVYKLWQDSSSNRSCTCFLYISSPSLARSLPLSLFLSVSLPLSPLHTYSTSD